MKTSIPPRLYVRPTVTLPGLLKAEFQYDEDVKWLLRLAEGCCPRRGQFATPCVKLEALRDTLSRILRLHKECAYTGTSR